MTEQAASEGHQSRELSVGKILASARMEQGLTTDMIAARLCLTESYIKFIESENFDSLPGDTFIRGYLRNYANVVGLNGEELVRIYLEQQNQLNQDGNERKGKGIAAKAAETSVLFWWLLIGLVVVVVALSLAMTEDEAETEVSQTQEVQSANQDVISDDQVKDTSLDDETAGEALTSSVDEGVAVEATENVSEASVSTESDATEGASNEIVSEAAQTNNANEVLTVESQSVSAPSLESAQVSNVADSLAKETLEFTFMGKCWYQVVDATGEKLAERTKSAGDVSSVTGVPPFTVTLGDSTVVEMLYDGKLVDLSPYHKRKSARFEVGE